MTRNKLRALRVLNGLNQLEMANRCGVTRSVYGAIERNEIDGSLKFWKKLMKEFNQSADDVLGMQFENIVI